MTLEDRLVRTGNLLFRWRSYLPLLVVVPMLWAVEGDPPASGSAASHEAWALFSMAVSFCGLGIRVLTIGYAPSGTSGRHTKRQVAGALNTTGMYSVVRHPLYLGNFVISLGILASCLSWGLTLVFVLAFWLYYERIMLAEERFLREKFGERFVDWASRTPAFIPAVNRWRRPEQPFSWRRVLRKEYTSVLLITACFFGLDAYRHFLHERRLVFEPHWTIPFLAGLLVYVTLRMLKKRTTLLRPETRCR
jgi:protein-S-isoprenylcysteine O-methyltransferase Ste14